MVNNRVMRKRQSYYVKCKHKTHEELTKSYALNRACHTVIGGLITALTILGSLLTGAIIILAQSTAGAVLDEYLHFLRTVIILVVLMSGYQAYCSWQSTIMQQHLQAKPDTRPAPPARAIRPSSRPEHQSRQARLRRQARKTR